MSRSRANRRLVVGNDGLPLRAMASTLVAMASNVIAIKAVCVCSRLGGGPVRKSPGAQAQDATGCASRYHYAGSPETFSQRKTKKKAERERSNIVC